MITHIVLFKLKDNTTENIEKTANVLMDMKDKIAELKHIEVGMDVTHSQRSYDMALITKFDSVADLEAYQTHPVHVKVAESATFVCPLSLPVPLDLKSGASVVLFPCRDRRRFVTVETPVASRSARKAKSLCSMPEPASGSWDSRWNANLVRDQSGSPCSLATLIGTTFKAFRFLLHYTMTKTRFGFLAMTARTQAWPKS